MHLTSGKWPEDPRNWQQAKWQVESFLIFISKIFFLVRVKYTLTSAPQVQTTLNNVWNHLKQFEEEYSQWLTAWSNFHSVLGSKEYLSTSDIHHKFAERYGVPRLHSECHHSVVMHTTLVQVRLTLVKPSWIYWNIWKPLGGGQAVNTDTWLKQERENNENDLPAITGKSNVILKKKKNQICLWKLKDQKLSLFLLLNPNQILSQMWLFLTMWIPILYLLVYGFRCIQKDQVLRTTI